MRTIYENQSDRDNEQAVADLISREKNLMLVKLHMKDRLDYVAFRGDEVRCFIEVRCRSVASTKYSDIMCNWHKTIFARQVMQTFNVPCYFFVQWTDRLGYIKFDEDQQDIELCTYFETSRFKTMGEQNG
jgi:hypothetical protein